MALFTNTEANKTSILDHDVMEVTLQLIMWKWMKILG